jgi:hypothetical protein
MAFTVKADPALARRYGIRLQELPLLCLGILDSAPEETGSRAFTYGESDMFLYASARESRIQERKSRRGSGPLVLSLPKQDGPDPSIELN